MAKAYKFTLDNIVNPHEKLLVTHGLQEEGWVDGENRLHRSAAERKRNTGSADANSGARTGNKDAADDV